MTNPHAPHLRHHEECVSRAIKLMQTQRGQEAAEGMYYIELFTWLVKRLKAGFPPAAPPANLLEDWKAIGEFRLGRMGKSG